MTHSEFSFPARVVTCEIANQFSYSKQHLPATETIDFQYLTPSSHKEFLTFIVQSDSSELSDKLTNETLTISLRCDGTVDRTQIDKIYVMAKVITKEGESELYFLGASEPKVRGANGVLQALKQACSNTLGPNGAQQILSRSTSLVTDGASVNTGEKGGLWTLFRQEYRDSNSEQPLPLFNVWCAVHRSNLAWKSTSDIVPEVKKMFQVIISISTYFHSSGIRTRELKAVAEETKCPLLHLPKLFEVRWSEFSYALLNAVLVSWKVLVEYMKSSSDSECRGFLKFLLTEDNLLLLSFLVDCLFVFKRYQKNLQSNDITLVDMEQATKTTQVRLEAMRETPLVGGWVEALQSQVQKLPDDTVQLNSIKLSTNRTRRGKEHHLYVSQERSVDAIINEISTSLVEFLNQRFSVDKEVLDTIKPFVQLQPSANIPKIHNLLGTDLDLATLALEYEEILSTDDIDSLRQLSLAGLVSRFASSSFKNVLIILARIFAAKPHSADVERLISTSNTLKNAIRSRLSVDSENEYLYIYHNMPPLALWNPRKAVHAWISSRQHRVKDTPKAPQQAWFRGILAEGGRVDNEDDTKLESAVNKKRKF